MRSIVSTPTNRILFITDFLPGFGHGFEPFLIGFQLAKLFYSSKWY
jgi:hypothetical protein